MDYFFQLGNDNGFALRNQNTDSGNVGISEEIALY